MISDQHRDNLTVIDLPSGRLRSVIEIGRYPETIASDAARAYVANWFSGDVSVIDLANKQELTRIKLCEGPRGMVLVRRKASVSTR